MIAPGLPGWEWSAETRAGWTEEETAYESGDLEGAAEASVRMSVDGPQRTPEEVTGDPVGIGCDGAALLRDAGRRMGWR